MDILPVSMTPVMSSNIVAIGYDEDNKELLIEFKNGRTYSYDDVPKEEYEGLMSSESHGSYFASNIRGRYSYYEK